MDAIFQRVEQFTSTIVAAGRPLGILSFAVICISLVLSPVLRRWAEENRAMVAVVIIGLLFLTVGDSIVDAILGT